MADKAFRVLLDLTELYIDNLKYVWVNVSTLELKTISDFKASILQKINLESRDIKIFVKEGLLLDNETINVLREDDVVKVQCKNLSSFASDAKEQKKCVKKRNYSECASDVVVDLKRSKTDVVLNDSSFVKKKKSKKLYSIDSAVPIVDKKNTNTIEVDKSDSNLNQNSDIFLNPHPNGLSYETKKHKKKDKINLDTTHCSNTHNSAKCSDNFFSCANVDATGNEMTPLNVKTVELDPLIDLSKSSENSKDFSEVSKDIKMTVGTSNNCPKKKRKRHRKRKNTVSAMIDISRDIDTDKFISFSNEVEEIRTEEMLECATSEVFHHPDSEIKLISTSKNVKPRHIIYSSLPCEDVKSVKIGDKTKEMHSSSCSTYIVNEDMSASNVQSFKDYPKVSTPNQSNKCRNLSWHVSLMQTKDSDTNNEPQDFTKKNVQNIVQEQSYLKGNTSKVGKMSSQLSYEDLPPLNSFPEIGTHIVYKILEMDECYCPVVSEYREGIVKRVNQNTEEIEIELLREVIKPGRIGKFENLKEDESPLPEIIKCDTVLWSSIISPKRLS